MKKTAVVYDKWLRSLGGGEVVACNIAKILADNGYNVTFVAGKKVDKEVIKNKLNINLSKVSMVEIWSDEAKIKQISVGKDLFVNTSFIDYTYGRAKRNIYYTHFPKEPYSTLGEMLFTKLLFPVLTRFIKPIELMSSLEVTTVKNNEPAYLLKGKNRIAISYLQKNQPQVVEFSLLLGCFTQSLMRAIEINFEEAEIKERKVHINHHCNQINFQFIINPLSATSYLEITINNSKAIKNESEVFLLYPKIGVWNVYEPVINIIYRRLSNKLRAGIFANALGRLGSYQVILANSLFTQKWISNYWKRRSVLIYPPVDLLFYRHSVNINKKKKWICSVGRFFKIGHGKKQEILIGAFKKFYDSGYTDWQLHLVGGVGSDESSLELVEELKRKAENYPIFFHLNVSRIEVEEVYLKSKIYWHAAGFGESEKRYPIKFEHFGIAPIEAISAGCIPLLYDGGGLREIINVIGLSQDLHLFKTVDQLVKNTIILTQLKSYNLDWEKIYDILSKTFSQEAFKKRFLEIVKDT